MPKRKSLRRFDPYFGVSQATIEVESKALTREVENKARMSVNELAKERAERHALCVQSWEALQGTLAKVADRERAGLQSLLFRDLYHVLELYRFYLRARASELSAVPPTPSESEVTPEFNEFLFDLQP